MPAAKLLACPRCQGADNIVRRHAARSQRGPGTLLPTCRWRFHTMSNDGGTEGSLRQSFRYPKGGPATGTGGAVAWLSGGLLADARGVATVLSLSSATVSGGMITETMAPVSAGCRDEHDVVDGVAVESVPDAGADDHSGGEATLESGNEVNTPRSPAASEWERLGTEPDNEDAELVNDPVGLYLRDVGRVALLNAEEERVPG